MQVWRARRSDRGLRNTGEAARPCSAMRAIRNHRVRSGAGRNELGVAWAQATPAKPEWADDLRREAGYFRQHQWRMNYLEMREDDWVIGSGMVEGGAKRYQARLCGPGMRWSRKGAANLTPVRTAILSGRFDERWRAAQKLPQRETRPLEGADLTVRQIVVK